MPNLYNILNSGTAEEVRLYNFISNQYFAGVPVGLTSNVTGNAADHTMNDWLANSAFDVGQHLYSGGNNYFYFPAVVGTPTEYEDFPGTLSASQYRFRAYRNRVDGPIIAHDHNLHLGAYQDVQSSIITYNVDFGLNANATNRLDLFNFGAKSATTLVECGIQLAGASGDYLYNMIRCIVTIQGWLHDGIYNQTTPINENYRYNNAFMMSLGWVTAYVGYANLVGYSPNIKGTNNNRAHQIAYRDIACQVGNYTPGLFMTDFVLHENTTRRPLGKVDNRVICLGRGNFEKGRVYRANNLFGRTGPEDWLCANHLVPSSYTIPSWTPGMSVDGIKAWAVNEEDFLMIRVYTEAD